MEKIDSNRPEESFPTIFDVYKNSKINYDDWIYECVILSFETSNNQEILENLSYYKFKGLIKSLNKYLEAKNNGGNPNEAEGQQDNMMNQAKSMMNMSKNTFGKGMSNFKKPKL